jgi:hypothetical protein
MFSVVYMLPITTFLLISYNLSYFALLPNRLLTMNLTVTHLVKKLEGSLTCSQQPATWLCPEPDNLVHTLHPICSWSILANFSYSEETKGGLWDHSAVCLSICLCVSHPNCFIFYAVSGVLKEIMRLVLPRTSCNITTRGRAVAQVVSVRGVSPGSISRHAVCVTDIVKLGRVFPSTSLSLTNSHSTFILASTL